MCIDQARPTRVEAGQVDLSHGRGGYRVQVAQRVETVIDGADVDVIDVEQDRAAAARGNLGEELPLRNRGMPELQIARDVLDQDLLPKMRLRQLDPGANMRK